MRVLGWVALASMLAVAMLGPSAGGALAATSLHQTPPISSTNPAFQGSIEDCQGLNLTAGQVVWHFVLVQTAGTTASTLTATFTTAGSITVSATKKTGSTLHFYVPTGVDTLTGATTTATGKNLNLSHICSGPPLTTTTTTTTTTTSSTTTTTSSTSTTTGPPPTACNASTLSGGPGTTVTTHQLGQAGGTFLFTYNTYSVPDSIVITYQGVTVFTTGGPVSTTVQQSANVTYGPGTATTVTVTVTGPAGTVWDYVVNCPAA